MLPIPITKNKVAHESDEFYGNVNRPKKELLIGMNFQQNRTDEVVFKLGVLIKADKTRYLHNLHLASSNLELLTFNSDQKYETEKD